jgi:hypothetical protein
MAADRTNAQRLNALRLKLMQEVLPVGLAVADRARKGGAKDVIAAFQGDADPIEQLRQEGEVAASQVRERLDRVSPGLGNPVVKVEVRDVAQDGMGEGLDGGFGAAIGANGSGASQASADLHDLEQGLSRIAERLQLLEQRLGAG